MPVKDITFIQWKKTRYLTAENVKYMLYYKMYILKRKLQTSDFGIIKIF